MSRRSHQYRDRPADVWLADIERVEALARDEEASDRFPCFCEPGWPDIECPLHFPENRWVHIVEQMKVVSWPTIAAALRVVLGTNPDPRWVVGDDLLEWTAPDGDVDDEVEPIAIADLPEPARTALRDAFTYRRPMPAPTPTLTPAEDIALTVAIAQLARGETPPPNTAAVCIAGLARLAGR